jgi:toxin ParE1/3/4
MTKVLLTREARNDLAAIGSWLAQRNPTAARAVIEALRRKLRMLENTPLAGRQRSDLAPGLFGLVTVPYLILYSHDQDTVTIVRILDGRRDLTQLFQD